MSRICFTLDNQHAQILRRESQNFSLPLSEFIRNKLFSSADYEQQKNSFNSKNFQQLNAEILELRKELRIVTGALVNIMQANELSIDDFKKVCA